MGDQGHESRGTICLKREIHYRWVGWPFSVTLFEIHHAESKTINYASNALCGVVYAQRIIDQSRDGYLGVVNIILICNLSLSFYNCKSFFLDLF